MRADRGSLGEAVEQQGAAGLWPGPTLCLDGVHIRVGRRDVYQRQMVRLPRGERVTGSPPLGVLSYNHIISLEGNPGP